LPAPRIGGAVVSDGDVPGVGFDNRKDETSKEFPPRQKAASFTIDQAVAKLEASLTADR
jgi:hypothetical protein